MQQPRQQHAHVLPLVLLLLLLLPLLLKQLVGLRCCWQDPLLEVVVAMVGTVVVAVLVSVAAAMAAVMDVMVEVAGVAVPVPDTVGCRSRTSRTQCTLTYADGIRL